MNSKVFKTKVSAQKYASNLIKQKCEDVQIWEIPAKKGKNTYIVLWIQNT